jgi:deoxycytidylate deaminase
MKSFSRLIEITKGLYPIDKSHRCFHCSFILNKNRIISIGINQPKKTHRKNLQFGYKNRNGEDISDLTGTHSELDACLKAGKKDFSNFILINVRIDNNGKINNSKPCLGCQNLIQQLDFKRVYYTDNNGKFKLLTFTQV